MHMAAIMSDNWEMWFNWNDVTAPRILKRPSNHSNFLRINAMSWLVQGSVNIYLGDSEKTVQNQTTIDTTMICGSLNHLARNCKVTKFEATRKSSQTARNA